MAEYLYDPEHPFHGIACKLKRVDENIINLNDEIDRFFKECKYPIIPHPNNEQWQNAVNYHRELRIPLRFSVLAGEVIHHLRACLDHVVWHFSTKQLHGAASRVPSGETAFPHRYDHFDLLVHPATDNPGDSGKITSWARQCWESLRPFVERAVYVNALEDAAEEGERRVREAYGMNYQRLVTLKQKFDPANLFRMNANIKPPKIATL